MPSQRARTSITRGVNDAVIRNSDRKKHRDLNPQGLLTPEVVRRFIEAATCPYCGAGPFRTLAGHTNRAHGIDARELRIAAHMSGNESIASAEYREYCRKRGKERGFGSGVDPSIAGKKARANGQGEVTAAGVDRQRENIEAVRKRLTADSYKAMRLKAWQTLVDTGRAGEKVAQLHRDKSGRTPAEVKAIVDEVRELQLDVSEVAEKYGYTRSGAYKIVNRAKPR